MERPHTIPGADLQLHIPKRPRQLVLRARRLGLRLLVKQFISLMHFECVCQGAKEPGILYPCILVAVPSTCPDPRMPRNVWKWRNGSAFQ